MWDSRTSCGGKACASGRNLPEQIVDVRIVVRIEIKTCQFKTPPFNGVKGRHNHLLVILSLLRNRTQLDGGLEQKLVPPSSIVNINSDGPPMTGSV